MFELRQWTDLKLPSCGKEMTAELPPKLLSRMCQYHKLMNIYIELGFLSFLKRKCCCGSCGAGNSMWVI